MLYTNMLISGIKGLTCNCYFVQELAASAVLSFIAWRQQRAYPSVSQYVICLMVGLAHSRWYLLSHCLVRRVGPLLADTFKTPAQNKMLLSSSRFRRSIINRIRSA